MLLELQKYLEADVGSSFQGGVWRRGAGGPGVIGAETHSIEFQILMCLAGFELETSHEAGKLANMIHLCVFTMMSLRCHSNYEMTLLPIVFPNHIFAMVAPKEAVVVPEGAAFAQTRNDGSDYAKTTVDEVTARVVYEPNRVE